MLNRRLHRYLRKPLPMSLHGLAFGGFLLLLGSLPACTQVNASATVSRDASAFTTVSYNRYQAIYFCKQNRWAFCQSWGELGVTRLA
ncbi:hypothetical protein SHAQ108633_05495 [Shewanella aquimarina]